METAVLLPMSAQKAKSVTETIKEFNRKLSGFVRNRVKSDEDAEDILQDVWMQLSNLGNIGDLENVSAWLYEVARNKITDKSRKRPTFRSRNSFTRTRRAGSTSRKYCCWTTPTTPSWHSSRNYFGRNSKRLWTNCPKTNARYFC